MINARKHDPKLATSKIEQCREELKHDTLC